MTTLREAAQQALEAMEFWCPAMGHALNKRAEAVVALRAALAEPVLNPAPGYCKHCKQYTIEEPLPAEPVQEPVAWRFQSAVGGWAYGSQPPVGIKYPVFPLYAAPPQRKPLTEDEIKDIWDQYRNIRSR